MTLKVRIGIGTVTTREPGRPSDVLTELIDELEARKIDSVWLSDLLSTPTTVDPLIGLGYAAGRTSSLKLGTGTLVLTGRHPVAVASQLAGLISLAPKRILPTFGIRAAQARDRYTPAQAAVFEESFVLVRRLLTEPVVTHEGPHFPVTEISVGPLPKRGPDIWLTGRIPAAMDRVGRLADGWLGANVTPAESEDCRKQIEQAATRAGREVEDDHYGTNVVVALTEEDRDAALAMIARQRPELDDPGVLVARGWTQARERVGEYLDAGLTKFVVRPAGPVESIPGFLDQFQAELAPLEN
ncbi:TIGR03854 family LLM class F420-dependent oxidoreductase [Pseudonocardiaceae bacterium YIM PH 21723]|nr:TIGR03854 family LLM class F420-dependent oxidoreductase [Pseudonocardiaceae bacterium YIM PH 21723]